MLTPDEADLFYRVWFALLRWVNETKGVAPGLDLHDDKEFDVGAVCAVRDALWADPALLDAFVATNPARLSETELALVAPWRLRRKGTFVVLRELVKHAIVIDGERAGTVYAVHGISHPLSAMLPWLPCMVDGVLLPFLGRIIFDGFLRSYPVHLGPGMRRRFDEDYRRAKATLVTRLGDVTPVHVATITLPRSSGVAPANDVSAAPAKKKPATAKKKPAAAGEKPAARARGEKAPVDPATLERPGRCELCGGVFSKRAMGRHLAACEEVAALGRGKPVMRTELVVESPELPMYWMVLDVAGDTTLASIDGVLRDVWLECCGHLSDFEIAGVTYASNPDLEGWSEREERSMRVKVSAVLGAPRWRYRYDYGTTTELRLRAAGSRVGPRGGPRVLARNVAPTWPCVGCGAAAVVVCAQCRWEDGGWLCARCAKTHDCGEDVQLPVVNSPRVGLCGYTG